MGRKADPKGKDRTRTIQLAGDVAEIAQKLADRGQLSATLSELLRHNYGFGDKIEEKKRELDALLNEKQALVAREADLIELIDELEQISLKKNATVRPALEKRRQILLDRWEKNTTKAAHAFDAQEKIRLSKVIDEITKLIAEVDAELEALN